MAEENPFADLIPKEANPFADLVPEQPKTKSEAALRRMGLLPIERRARINQLDDEIASIEPSGFIKGAREVAGGALSDLRGLPEAAAELISGGVSSAAGGAAAIPVTAIDAIRNTDLFGNSGSGDAAGASRAVIEKFQDIGTFQPRTEVGKRASESIQKPLAKFEEFADTVGEVTGDPDDVLGATLVKTAILGSAALFGLRRGAVTTKAPKRPTPRQQVAAQAADEGYVTPPSVRGDAGAAGLAEGLGGKIKTGQQAIETNQAVTNKIAGRAVGLPDGVPVTIDILQGIRAQAGQAYEAARGAGQIFTDTVFRRDLSTATARFKSAAKDFPELAKNEVTNIVDSLRVAEFQAGSGIDAISLLRNKADVAFRGGDKALGNSYKSAANAVESVMERHLARGGDANLLDSFRQSRQQIAETYSVQEALQGRITGEVSATQLAAQLKKGKPLSGDLRQIADFANTFPTVSRLFTGSAQKFSPLDLAVGGGSIGAAATATAAGLGPAAALPLVGTIARPLLRKAALRKPTKASGSTTPKASTVGGGLLSAGSDNER